MSSTLLLIALSAVPMAKPATQPASQPAVPEAYILRVLEGTLSDARRLDEHSASGRSIQAERLYRKAQDLLARLPADRLPHIREEIANRLVPPEKREDKTYTAGSWQFRITLAGWRGRPRNMGIYKTLQRTARSHNVYLDDHAFVRIHIAIANHGKTSQMLPTFKLLDEDGAQYEPYWLNGKSYQGFERINPNRQVAAAYEWEVPLLGRYSLLVTDGEGHSVTIKLGEMPEYVSDPKNPLDLRPILRFVD